MALTLCEHPCKTVCDVKPGIDPCRALHQFSHGTAHIISNSRLLLKKNLDVGKNVTLLLEQLQARIFAEIVFGVRCTLTVA